MTVTKAVVIYSKAQKVRRRVIKLDHEGAHDGHFDPHKEILHLNEGWLEIPIELYESFDPNKNELDNYVASQIGEPSSDRCVVVCPMEGIVKHILKADPDIDFHPDGKIIFHETAIKGEKP